MIEIVQLINQSTKVAKPFFLKHIRMCSLFTRKPKSDVIRLCTWKKQLISNITLKKLLAFYWITIETVNSVISLTSKIDFFFLFFIIVYFLFRFTQNHIKSKQRECYSLVKCKNLHKYCVFMLYTFYRVIKIKYINRLWQMVVLVLYSNIQHMSIEIDFSLLFLLSLTSIFQCISFECNQFSNAK